MILSPPDCSRCPLRRCKRVEPEGNPRAQIAVVGEGPGWVETRVGKPFQGPSGQLLNRILAEAGIERRKVWVSNAALCQPQPAEVVPGVWIGRDEARDASIRCCTPRLRKELAQIRPRVVIALGGKALGALTSYTQISERHGSLHPVDLQGLASGEVAQSLCEKDLTYVVPLFHPAYLLRNKGQFHPVLVGVFKRVRKLLDGRAPPLWRELLVAPHVYDVDTKLAHAEAWVDRWIAEGRAVAIDVETTTETARTAALTVLGFACQEYNLGIALTIREWNEATQSYAFTWNAEQWAQIQRIAVKLLTSQVPKLYHNFGYDVTVLRRFWQHNGPVLDTIVLHYLFQPDLPHNLGFVSQSLLDIPAWKRDFRQMEVRGKATNLHLLHYNAQDHNNTGRIAGPLLHLVQKRGNDHLIAHHMRNSELARRAQLHGIPMDMAIWHRVYDDRRARRDAARAKIREAIRAKEGAEAWLNEVVAAQRADPSKHKHIPWDRFNVRSARQARWFLYDFLNLQPIYYTKGGKDKDVDAQEPSHAGKAVRDYLNIPLIAAYVDFMETGALLQGTLTPFKHCYDPITQRLYVSWSATSQKGTRHTSRPNCQNVEKSVREIFKAPKGYVWVAADAAALEYRIAACFAGIRELLHLFNDVHFDEKTEKWKKLDPRYDAHAMIAVEVFGQDYLRGDDKHKDALRTLVKRVVYALFYGAFPQKIYDSIRQDRRISIAARAILTLERIEQIHEGFRARFPEWDRWAEREEFFVKTHGYQVFPPFDRRRYWPLADFGIVESTKLRNTPIQLAAGDVVNAIFWGIEEEVQERELDASFSIHLHDAGYWCTAEKDADAMVEVVDRHFDTHLVSYAGHKVHIFGQAGIGATADKVG